MQQESRSGCVRDHAGTGFVEDILRHRHTQKPTTMPFVDFGFGGDLGEADGTINWDRSGDVIVIDVSQGHFVVMLAAEIAEMIGRCGHQIQKGLCRFPNCVAGLEDLFGGLRERYRAIGRE